jgi:glutamine synthetase
MNEPQAELDRFLANHPQVQSVDLVVYDLHGIPRGKIIRIKELENIYRDGMAFSGSVFGLDPTGHVIPDTGLGLEVGDPDCSCRPIPGSLARVPWQTRPLGQVQLTMFERDGRPFFADPRQVLGRVLASFEAERLRPVVAVELEFYLLDPAAARAAVQVRPPVSPLTGVRDYGDQVYALDELDAYRDLLDDVTAGAEALGIPLTTAVSESSPGQLEINLRHDADVLRACDHALALKRVIKGVARNHNLVASFMAKPYPERAGSGMHVHASVIDDAGANIFAGPERELNDALRRTVAGSLALLRDATAILAPNANSYRRLRPDTFAPTNITWGFENRSVAVRVPGGHPSARRIEHRVAGADCNPYLVVAAVLAGIRYGLDRQLDPGPAVEGNAGALASATLPGNWADALASLDRSAPLRAAFGDRFVELYCDCKRYERRAFERQVTPLEYGWYLHRI